MKMPKVGQDRAEWERRLREYADGQFHFSTGQRPPKDSYWARQIASIDRCPRKGGQTKDLFGRPLACNCGYHKKQSDSGAGSSQKTPASVMSNWIPLCPSPQLALRQHLERHLGQPTELGTPQSRKQRLNHHDKLHHSQAGDGCLLFPIGGTRP